MIVLAQTAGALERGCELFPTVGTQIYGYFDRYGNDYPFCTAWLCQNEKEVWGSLGRYNQSLRLSCNLLLSEEQIQEIAEFLGIAGCTTLEAPAFVLEQLRMFLGEKWKLFDGAAMEYVGTYFSETDERINSVPRLDDVFRILRESDTHFAATAQFDEWLCDAAHCRNHNGGWYAAIDNAAVSGVTALSLKYGLIGSVATHPQARRMGYASALIKWCVNRVLESGRKPILEAANEQVISMYRKIGFVETGRWGIVSF